MGTEKFEIKGNTVFESQSRMQLQMISAETISNDSCWINGWFNTGNQGLVIKKFIVLDIGNPTYKLASKAVDYWGKQVLGLAQADAIEMSPLFGSRLVIPAIRSECFIK